MGKNPSQYESRKGPQVVVGKNDLMTVRPDLASRIIEPNPMSVGVFSMRWGTWFCNEGHIYEKVIRECTQSLNSCPYCAETQHGYQDHLPGYVYLLIHSSIGASKIGISNNPQKRLEAHRRNGWIAVDIVGPLDGIVAKEYESAILAELRSRGISAEGGHVAAPRDGHTETWSTGDLPARNIKEIMDILGAKV